eukprot:323858-Rhodomonas_salina.8
MAIAVLMHAMLLPGEKRSLRAPSQGSPMEFLASSSTEAHTPKLSRIASTNPPLLSYDLPTSSPVLILGGICYTVSCTGRVYCAMPMMHRASVRRYEGATPQPVLTEGIVLPGSAAGRLGDRRGHLLSPYARAMRCPVLTLRFMLLAYARAMPRPVLTRRPELKAYA